MSDTLDLCRARVTVQYVNPPKAPRKSGTIKDVDGQIFSVWPNMLNQFRAGETYDIEFTEKNVNGAIFRDVKSVAPANPSRATQAANTENYPSRQAERPRAQAHSAQRGPAVQSTPVEPPREPQHNGNANGNGYYRPTHPRDAERMFVCSTLNAFIQTGRIENDVDALRDAVTKLRQVWGDTFGHDDQA